MNSATMRRGPYDVAVIGSGPNGLAAAIVAAERGLSTVVFEANDTIGGGLRSAELTQPGFVHDVCSSVHPMAVASPFFRRLQLERYGLEWITPPAAAAHPLDDGAVILWNDVERTAEALGVDRRRYEHTIGAIARDWSSLEADILAPLGFPRHPLSFARFGAQALMPAARYARLVFKTARARALFPDARHIRSSRCRSPAAVRSPSRLGRRACAWLACGARRLATTHQRARLPSPRTRRRDRHRDTN